MPARKRWLMRKNCWPSWKSSVARPRKKLHNGRLKLQDAAKAGKAKAQTKAQKVIGELEELLDSLKERQTQTRSYIQQLKRDAQDSLKLAQGVGKVREAAAKALDQRAAKTSKPAAAKPVTKAAAAKPAAKPAAKATAAAKPAAKPAAKATAAAKPAAKPAAKAAAAAKPVAKATAAAKPAAKPAAKATAAAKPAAKPAAKATAAAKPAAKPTAKATAAAKPAAKPAAKATAAAKPAAKPAAKATAAAKPAAKPAAAKTPAKAAAAKPAAKPACRQGSSTYGRQTRRQASSCQACCQQASRSQTGYASRQHSGRRDQLGHPGQLR
ncbi:alginate regulatory protein AlgP [Pseudomonas putida S11]|nr:alginate regulatory protein AlgP [Pseudomonas putida S11]